MRRIRTLILHPAIAPYRIDLFNRLADELDLRIAFLEQQVRYDPNSDQQGLLGQLRCDYRMMDYNFSFAGHDIRFGLLREIRDFKPQVVVTHEFSHATFSAFIYRRLFFKKRFGMVVWTDENIDMLKARGPVRAALLRTGAQKARSVIVCSEQIAKSISAFARVDEGKFFTCAPNHDETIFRRKLDEATPEARRYVCDYKLEGKKVLLSVGRLAPVKNTSSLLSAFSGVVQHRPGTILVVVGDGPQKKELEEKAVMLGISNQVLFAGHLKGPSLFAWWRLASRLVLASTFEPFGAVVCEALLSGVQVLCSSAAGASALIEDGENGRVFNPIDINKLTSLLDEETGKGVNADELIERNRPSLMPFPFEHDVKSFVSAAEHAAHHSKDKG